MLKNPNIILLFILAGYQLFITPEQAQSRTDKRLFHYDVQHYDLSIKFDILKQSFSGKVRVHAITLEPLSEIVLSASNETLTLDSVIYKNKKVRFEHKDNYLFVNCEEYIEDNSELDLVIHYRGISKYHGQYEGGGVMMYIAKGFGHIATSSQPYYARTWWPCKDVPSDKATVTINITVPSNLTAISNGILLSTERTRGFTTYCWSTQYPTSTYLVAIAVGKYKHYTETYTALDKRKMKISYYVFPEKLEKAKVDFENVRNMLHYFASTFCEYPFINEKLAFVEVGGNMTMENQTMCTIDERLITGTKQFESTIVHEVAHQWWGNLITPATWHHTWISEGFATYAEALYLEHTKGTKAYTNYMNQLMGVKQGFYAGSVFGQSDTAFWDSFAPRVYYKGAIILHMLRGIVGDSAFFTIMRNYLNNPRLRYGNATTEDFIRECETVTQKNLQWFFNQWVYKYTESIDRPEYEYSWRIDSPTLTLTVEQKTAAHMVYRMPLKVYVKTSDAEHIFSIVDSLPIQQFTFTVHGKPHSVDIDKDNWVFKIINKRNSR